MYFHCFSAAASVSSTIGSSVVAVLTLRPASAASSFTRRLNCFVCSTVTPPMKLYFPYLAVNRNPSSDVPAQIMNGCGFCTGLGDERQSFKWNHSPSKVTDSSDHRRFTTSSHSAAYL